MIALRPWQIHLLAALLVGGVLALLPSAVTAQYIEESRADQAWQRFGVSGEGVIIAVLDRGIDYEHPDFINEDGSTRILSILDLSDDSGANDPDNPLPYGTVYTEDEINAALTSGTRLATRDARGHGTPTAGIAGGNGRASSGARMGVAPGAEFVIVKFTSEGSPAHGSEAAEAPFYDDTRLGPALDFVFDIGDAEGKPVVATANFGSIQGPSDGTSSVARAIDARVGPGIEGRVFVSGSSDDGGKDNHASGTIGQGETVDLNIKKAHPGNLRVDLWYDEADRFEVSLVTPTGTFGPWAAPGAANGGTNHSGTGFSLFQRGSDADFFGATSSKREILVDINGAAGDYVLRLTGTTVSNGVFHALMNPSNIFSQPDNRFESFVVAGHTVWDAASALHAIVPNSYVHAPEWIDIDGVTRMGVGNEGGIGSLWTGSGIGPTLDGRLGVTVSAPGQNNIGSYAPRSYFATFRRVLAQGGGGFYGELSAVSGANPVLTGAIALMLEVDPSLDAVQVRDILMATAREDSFTGTTPNPTWGGGKLDVEAAVEAVVSATSVDDVLEGGAFEVDAAYPNPATGVTTIRYRGARGALVGGGVYDLLGRRVLVVEERTSDGAISIDTSLLPAGWYFVQLDAGRVSATVPLVVLR